MDGQRQINQNKLKGVWWIPFEPTKRVKGFLLIGRNKSSRLDLDSYLLSEEAIQKSSIPGIIYGELEDKRSVTALYGRVLKGSKDTSLRKINRKSFDIESFIVGKYF
ncbi:MAG TPA: hypothetical protein VE548_10050 [Nitrososphaeraceae archaeon]|nr:hypothetical protein [Nitrososphaeraceae archaeon]